MSVDAARCLKREVKIFDFASNSASSVRICHGEVERYCWSFGSMRELEVVSNARAIPSIRWGFCVVI